jgi:hypothetical protein
VWYPDQIEFLDLYRNEINNTTKEFKNEIKIYKKEYEKYSLEFEKKNQDFLEQTKKCNNLKNKLEEYIESKSAYESVINVLCKENQSIKIFKESNHRENQKNADDSYMEVPFKYPEHSNNALLKVKKKLEKINFGLQKYNKKLLKNVI